MGYGARVPTKGMGNIIIPKSTKTSNTTRQTLRTKVSTQSSLSAPRVENLALMFVPHAASIAMKNAIAHAITNPIRVQLATSKNLPRKTRR